MDDTKVSEQYVLEAFANLGCSNVKILSKIQYGVSIFHCIMFITKDSEVNITYIINLSLENIEYRGRIGSYTIKQFIDDHNDGRFMEFLTEDFNTNPEFSIIKALS